MDAERRFEVRDLMEIMFEFSFQVVILRSEKITSHFDLRDHSVSKARRTFHLDRCCSCHSLIRVEDGKRVDEREILSDLVEFRVRNVPVAIVIVGGENRFDHGVDVPLDRLNIDRLTDAGGPIGEDGTLHLLLLLVDVRRRIVGGISGM